MGNVFFDLKITDILYTYILGKTSSFKIRSKNNDFRICVEIPIKAKFKNELQMFAKLRKRENWWEKKVNPLKDGLLILSEIVKYFFRLKNKY